MKHPAHAWIVKQRREVMFSIGSLPTLENENFTQKQVLFDLLHGLLNAVKNAPQALLFDIALCNEDVFLISLTDAFFGYHYLEMLNAPPFNEDEECGKVAALDGNGCVEMLNNWEQIIKQLLGADALKEAERRNAGEQIDGPVCSDPRVISAIQEQARVIVQSAQASEEKAATLRRAREAGDAPSFEERIESARPPASPSTRPPVRVLIYNFEAREVRRTRAHGESSFESSFKSSACHRIAVARQLRASVPAVPSLVTKNQAEPERDGATGVRLVASCNSLVSWLFWHCK